MNTFSRFTFLILSSIFILSLSIKPYPLSWLVKLLPMLFLAGFVWQRFKSTIHLAKNTDSKQLHIAVKFLLIGLVFSGFGDFFLDYDRINWFIFGLGAFFLAHLSYLRSFSPIETKNIAWVVAYLVYGASIFFLISGGLGELFIPVLFYMLVLLIMGIFTVLSKRSNVWLIIGGASFVFSDSLIGIDKFYIEIPYVEYFIMSSYYFAQFSLVNALFYQNNR